MEEKWRVQMAMQKYGGSFVKHLGEALMHADSDNSQRIYDAFPEYWMKYLGIAMKQEIDKEED